MGWIFPLQPPNFVDLLLDLETLQVVELWLVALEGAVDVVLAPAGSAALGLRVPLEDDHATALVPRREEIPVLVELDARDDVGLCDIVVEGPLHLREAPLDLGRGRRA